MTDLTELRADIESLRGAFRALSANVQKSFLGQEDVTELLLTCLLAGGHALLEGAPGLGKTTLVRSLATSVHLDFKRVQFTPDLMPPDVLGSRILEDKADGTGREFRVEKGPIFTHVLLADEINRATPRTQSALLEAMQEGQVTLYGEKFELEEPFIVIATQNPIEMEGTYPLPEAQLDRFLVKISLELPDRDELGEILVATTGERRPEPEPVLTREKVVRMRKLVRDVRVNSDIVRLVSALVHATHPGTPLAPERIRSLVRYGSSPRGGQALILAAKARALVKGAESVRPEDIDALAAPCMRHRLILGYEAEAQRVSPDDLVAEALAAARKAV